MNKLLLATLLFFAPALAQATSGHWYYNYYTYLHFSERYFDRKVEAVYAHVGVETFERGYGTARNWTDTQHIEMQRRGNHFFAKAVLGAELHTHYGPGVEGPIVQYWVYLDNGEVMLTTPSLIRKRRLGTGQVVSSIESLRGTKELLDYENATFTSADDDQATHADEFGGGYSS